MNKSFRENKTDKHSQKTNKNYKNEEGNGWNCLRPENEELNE